MDKKTRRERAKTHISPKLRRSLRLFLLISAILLIVVIFETIQYHAIVWQVGLGLIVGVLVGIILSRMYKISWDEDAQHASNSIDIYGFAVLGLWIAFDLFRGNLVNVFTHNQSVPAISLALLAGAMYGRVLGSVRVIVRMLKEQKVFSRVSEW